MFETLYEDKNLKVFNKPANVSLLADRSGLSDMWQQLKNSGEKPNLVHRLDKGTSGVLLVARNQSTQS
jgi:23S rRNA-/tRNA-specific pseudouridylate synthase